MNTALKTKTLIQEIAEWSSALKFDEIPGRIIDKAKLQILSVLAAIHSSARTRAGKILIETAKEFYGPGKSTLLPGGDKASISAAALCWAGLSVAQDYDCYLLFGHTGHSAVSASLLTGEFSGANAREILCAQVIANEIEGRIGASVLLGPHNGQGWSFIHLIGAAAAASRLLGLDAEKTSQALAVSFYQPTYVLYPGFMGPDSKLLTSATPTVVGMQAAFLAQKGFTGALDILENHQGFFNHFAYYPLPMMVSGLGKAWVTDTLAYKIYPGCAYIDTTVDSMFEIIGQHKKETGKELDADDIAQITVEATALTVEMDNLSKVGISFDPLNPVSINFSIPGNIALSVIHGKLSGAELREENLEKDAERIMKLAGKVRLVHNLEMTADMMKQMNPALRIPELFRELSLLRMFSAQRRITRQYGRRMGLEWQEVKKYLREHGREIFGDLERGARLRLGNWLIREPGEKWEWSLADADLENFTMPFSARVTVALKNGKTLEHRQDIPNGGPGQPMEQRQKLVVEKFSREAGPALGEKTVRKVSEKILDFENMRGAGKLLEELCEG
jgi:2-methylcitrate dehydratase PrpD